MESQTQTESLDIDVSFIDTPSDLIGEADGPSKKGRSHRKENAPREPGKSLLPFARVQKIIKADKDIPIIAKDATFLISLATEEFIKRICEAGQVIARRENRNILQYRDLALVVRKADEFMFLGEIIPPLNPSDITTRKPKATAQSDGVQAAPTMLDQFVGGGKGVETTSDSNDGDKTIITDEDGSMHVAENPNEFD